MTRHASKSPGKPHLSRELNQRRQRTWNCRIVLSILRPQLQSWAFQIHRVAVNHRISTSLGGGGWQNPNFDQSETRLESRKCRKQKVNSLHPEAGLPGHRPVTTRPVPGKVSRRNGKRHERHNTRDRPSHVETTEHPEQVAAQPLWFGHL